MTGAPMPSRGNLVAECVRVMHLRIASGEWPKLLPGERRLAETLQVGRDTIRLALQQLERDGVLAAADAGARRRVIDAGGETVREKTAALRIGLLAHRRLEQLPQPMLLEIDQVREALSSKGGSLEVFAPGWYEQKNPAKRLEDFVEEQRCSAWMLLRSTAAVQGWFMKGRIPALIRGYPHPGIGLPHLDVDWQATAHHAAGHLWRMGHRRVVVLSPADALMGVEAAVRGVMELGEPGFEATVLVENGSPGGVGRVLARALNFKSPPTAIIATRPRQAATALTWLASQGLQVPRHLSLITLGWEPSLDHLVPEITGYRVDPEAVAKLVVRRLERIAAGDPNPGGNAWITPETVKGASVGKV
ncbi:substrate-binding domain-containing protein [Luteolibacter arcticus]|uniref:Substrate-binding domain-containing protein n=1 Tax=Luteolibacter arcticus TaxID=1581411 RepID=A0ABT3GQG8_9BACT|nr:substrate-binding domain-containing protein [Luteolibacter arcticus]MCW1925771.1 substrate-binding domain-containing protein [Luteolibacter arcticus]